MEQQLKDAIIGQLGYDEMNEEALGELETVRRGGANCGIGGFIYSNELAEFYRANKKLILTHLKDFAESLGESGMLEMIAGFNCLKDSDITTTEIGEILWTDEEHECREMVIDAVCWAVLEDLAAEYDC